MKKILILGMALILAAIFSGAGAEEVKGMDMGNGTKAKVLTVTGKLVDSSCYLEDGVSGNDHDGMKACGAKCLEGGSPAGLVVGKKLYTLEFPAPVFKDYVGQQVQITGNLYLGDQLIPQKAFLIKDGKKREIKIEGQSMM